MTRPRLIIPFLALLAPPLLGAGALGAQQGPAIPPPRGMVNDFASVIPADRAARIERIATYVREKSKGEITVVTLPDIGGRDVGETALRIGREWKVGANSAIGDAARNAGTVILLVPKETSADGKGHISITTGQGTEGFITDGIAGDIRREATPLLAQRDYGRGLELITLRVAERYAANFGFALDSLGPAPVSEQVRRPTRSRQSGFPPWMFLVLFVVVMALLRGRGGGGGSGCLWFALGSALNSGGSGGGGFGGGGGGGGFGGFGGGGGFSGGGSSGSF